MEAKVASALKALPRTQRELYIASADSDLIIANELFEAFREIASRLELRAVEVKGSVPKRAETAEK
jgi:hypothetical protein